MKASLPMQQQVIQQCCKQLRVPMIGAQFLRLAEAAANQRQSYLDYLEALLSAEMDEREHNTVERRLRAAHLPKVKTRDEFNFQFGDVYIREQVEGTRRGHLHRSRGAGTVHRRQRNRQDALADGAVCGSLPSEAQSTVCDRHEPDQRTGGGAA